MKYANEKMAWAYVEELCGSKPKLSTHSPGRITFELTAPQYSHAYGEMTRYFGDHHIESWTDSGYGWNMVYEKWNLFNGRLIEMQIDKERVGMSKSWTTCRTITLIDNN